MKIKIKDFQSLKNVELNVEGLTILTGSNNTGKSAVVRAVSGVFNNTRGHSFVRYGEPFSSVSVRFSDTEEVTWEKGKGTNRYTINGKVFDKVGANPPDELKDLGVYSLKAGGKDIAPQLAPQFTGQVFLLDQAGSVIADCIADAERVVGLNKALRESEKEKRSLGSILKVREGDFREIEAKIKSYDGLDDLIQETEALGKSEAKIAKAKRMRSWLLEVMGNIQSERHTISTLEPISNMNVPNVKGLEADVTLLDWAQATNLKLKRDRCWSQVNLEGLNLSSLLNKIEALTWLVGAREAQVEANKKIECYESVEIPDNPKLIRACKVYEETLETREAYRATKEALEGYKQKLSALENIASELEEQIKSVSKVCPACGRDLEGSAHC